MRRQIPIGMGRNKIQDLKVVIPLTVQRTLTVVPMPAAINDSQLCVQARAVLVDMEEGVVNEMLKVRLFAGTH